MPINKRLLLSLGLAFVASVYCDKVTRGPDSTAPPTTTLPAPRPSPSPSPSPSPLPSPTAVVTGAPVVDGEFACGSTSQCASGQAMVGIQDGTACGVLNRVRCCNLAVRR